MERSGRHHQPWNPESDGFRRFRGTAHERQRRFLRWCHLRTLHDARQAARRGQPISPANLRRLQLRRLYSIDLSADKTLVD